MSFPDPYDRRDPKNPDYLADLEEQVDVNREGQW